MNAKKGDNGTAVWWFTAAAIAFTSVTVFFSDMPRAFQLAVMALGVVLLVRGIITYRKERTPRPPRR